MAISDTSVTSSAPELWVCFEPAKDVPPDAVIVSFASPGEDVALSARYPGRVVSGRRAVQSVRAEGRDEYVQLIARIGATPCVEGRTLRESLRGNAAYSRWWFLDLTEKDCVWDDDPTYTTVLRLLAVEAVARQHQCSRVVVHGGTPEFAAMVSARPRSAGSTVGVAARAAAAGLAGRAAFVIECLVAWRACRGISRASRRCDVLLQSYWDWSVRPAGDTLKDRYFTDLPDQLERRGVSVGWLSAFEPFSEGWQQGRSRGDVAASARARENVTLLESYLSPGDILRAAVNLRDAVRVTRAALSTQFRGLCRIRGFDLFPLIRIRLLRAAWGATACRLQLLALAAGRAVHAHRPTVLLTFLEMFLRSRAFCVGVRSGSPDTHIWAAQHAGYSSDKTMGVFDHRTEIAGEPDGCPAPAPDGLFVMGDLSRRIWEANRLGDGRVVVTGGLRYQSVGISARRPVRRSPLTVLLPGGMNEAAEVDVCDAAVAAVSGVEGIRLLWRDHPNYRFTQRAAFDRFRGAIEVTSGSVDDDLEAADLVLFTHTGLAEEGFLRGIPTWQWLWPGFNTSPFLDVPVIPAFTSVAELRRELLAFVQDPERYTPTAEAQRRVLFECFGPEPAVASARIAEAVQQMVRAGAGVHT